HLAGPLHAVDPQAAPRPADEPDHEAPRLRLVRRVLDGSDYGINMLVGAGPAIATCRENAGHARRIPVPLRDGMATLRAPKSTPDFGPASTVTTDRQAEPRSGIPWFSGLVRS